MKVQRKKRCVRSSRGAIGYVLVGVILIVCISISALAVDFAHGVMARAQLQSACDAGALAGAQDLIGAAGPLTSAQIATVEGNARAVAAQNFVDDGMVIATVDKPAPTYNSPPYTALNPQYTVTVSATRTLNNCLARALGCSNTPVSAIARAGIFPASTSTSVYGSLGQITTPIAVGININANNDVNKGRSLAQTVKGQVFKIQADGNTGGGDQNSSWVQLTAGNVGSPLSPMDSGESLTTQWASQSKAGIMTASNGTDYLYVSGASNDKTTNGNSGWTPYICSQVVANGGSVNITVPIIYVPTGNAVPNSLNPGNVFQIVGVATFNITNTAKGPGDNMKGTAVFYGTLVNAMPMDALSYAQFSGFFGQFQNGNSNGRGGGTSGTPQMRLY